MIEACNMKKELNMKIFPEIAEKTFNKGLKEVKAFWIWSLILSLPLKERYNYGNSSQYAVDKRKIIYIFGKYGYEIFKEMKKNKIFFVQDNKNIFDDADLLRAKSPEEIINIFGLNYSTAKKYMVIKCEYKLYNFRDAVKKTVYQNTRLKKDLAKKLKLTPQTISRFISKSKNKFEIIVKKLWEKVGHINYEDIRLLMYSSTEKMSKQAFGVLQAIRNNDLVFNTT